jgi:hypothetical protein
VSNQPKTALTDPFFNALLEQNELARRWRMSPRTLEQWRWQGRGPRFLKLGGRVVYPASEVEAFEAVNLHDNTVAPLTSEQRERASEAR